MATEFTAVHGASGQLDSFYQNNSSQGLSTPIRGFRFTVEFAGVNGVTSFKSVEGFTTELETVEYREGGFQSLAKRKLPGLVNYSEITLQKGVYQSLDLYNFFMSYVYGEAKDPIEETTIKVYGADGIKVAAQWHVQWAWPTKYETTGLTADSSDIVVETLVLVHEGLKRVPTA